MRRAEPELDPVYKEAGMHRRLIALCAASLISMGMPLLAQSGHSDAQYNEKETTIQGCLQKNKSGGFWLTEATIESAGAKSRVSGTSGSTTTADDKDMRSAMAHHMWNLENGKDLDRYLNQTIEVTGRAKNDTSGDKLKGAKGHEMQARDFDVKSVTRIAESCR
jgi:hypothetical protein